MNVFRSSRIEGVLDDEIRFHIESRTHELVSAGMAREEAGRVARTQFGNRLRLRESSREHEVRFALVFGARS